MAAIIIVVLQIFAWVLIARAVLSWFSAAPGSTLSGVQRSVGRVTEPVLAPVRRRLPRVGSLDLSVLVVLLAINLLVIPVVALL
ncbi:YggT family protein [Euzebya tangerina]|uniref:YggT family protein n=1 Tax=Euzebya tangerina TaxID=591198 RepID=UPI000E30E39B|nr:YggT family protein [Euzebya tangerina]